MKNEDLVLVPSGGVYSETFAYHESGHAIGAKYYGQSVSKIDITTPIPTTTHSRSKGTGELAVMILAGVAAQVIWEWPRLTGIWKDSRENLVRKRLDSNTFDLREYKKIADPDNPETFNSHASKALEILNADWEKVKIIAEHLRTTGKVASNEEFLQLLGES